MWHARAASSAALRQQGAELQWKLLCSLNNSIVERAQLVSGCIGGCSNTAAAVQGRDSTRNLNRSIKAKKLQERLLPSVQDLCAQLQAWAQDSGRPFILDNQDFLVPPFCVQRLQCKVSVGMSDSREGKQAACHCSRAARRGLLSCRVELQSLVSLGINACCDQRQKSGA